MPSLLPCLLTSQLMRSVISKTQRVEQTIQLFCIWKVKNQSFQFLSIFHRIFYGIAHLFYLEEALKVFKIGKEEIKKVIEVTPLTEKHGKLIRFFSFFFDCPKMIIGKYGAYKFYNPAI